MSDDKSVKNILEDIKRAISGSSNLDENQDILYLKEEYLQNKKDLKKEYNRKQIDVKERIEEINGKTEEKVVEHDIMKHGNEETLNSKLNSHEELLHKVNLYNERQEEINGKIREKMVEHDVGKKHGNKEALNNKLNDHGELPYKADLYNDGNVHEGNLILKENIDEIKMLLGNIQSKLQKSKPMLTVEELLISLLRPQLSEWLNKHLYELVKEVVEKELKSIINNR